MTSFADRTDNFSKWLVDQKVTLSPKVALKDLRDQNQGRGLVAVEDIGVDEVLFTIPRTACINVDNCTLVKDKPELKDKLMTLNHWDSLIIVLLYEIKVVKQSNWIPYFNILPINDEENYVFDQLMFWSDVELESLNPSLITERIGKDLAAGMYKKLHPKITVEEFGLTSVADFSLEEYNKIASLIMSYSFDMERLEFLAKNKRKNEEEEDDDEYEEVDIEDSKNHASEPTQERIPTDDETEKNILNDGFFKTMIPLADSLNADTTRHNASLMYVEKDLVMKSIKPIKKGYQVYNTYSDHPNSEILRRYGYVEIIGSKHDFGEIPLAVIKKVFLDTKTISESFLNELLSIINEIIARDTDNELVDIVLDSYDCFISGEVILELIFIIQVLTILVAINLLKSMEHLRYESKYTLILRIFKKCYQLIESKKLTKLFLSNYRKILNLRLLSYPDIANKAFNNDQKIILSRELMANIVLKSEYQSLTNCLDEDKVFSRDEKYAFIDDDKLIRNIVKKKFFGDSPSTDEDFLIVDEPTAKKQKIDKSSKKTEE